MPRASTLGPIVTAIAMVGALSLGRAPSPSSTLPRGVTIQLRSGELTLGLGEGWRVDSQTKDAAHASHCLPRQICTWLALYPQGLDAETAVAACAGRPLPKGNRLVGGKPAHYYEQAGCGENGQFYERIWVVGGTVIVVWSTAQGNQNNIDSIMTDNVAWRLSPE
jgi:hypothetical protein